MMNTTPQESATRKVIDDLLSHLGWIIDERDRKCNVFTERAKTNKQAILLDNKRPDYVLYRDDTDTPIAIIEAKRPGVTLDGAIEKAVSCYAKPLDINIIFATDGVLCRSFDRRSNDSLILDGEPVVDLISPKLLWQFVLDGPTLNTPSKIRQNKKDLINIFKDANDLLRKEGLRQGIERFSEFSNLIFLKLISEIEDERDNNGEARRLDKRYCWDSFSRKSPEDMLDYINDTVLPRLVQSYNHSDDIFQNRLGIAKPETLHNVVEKLSKLSLLDTDSDVKGDAFEYFLKHSVTVGNDLGEYFTPRHIVKIIVDLIDPNYMEKVYDPCCGTGGFLIEAFRHISRKVRLTEDTRQVLENDTIFGRELTGTAKIAKMNMILAGDGHTHIHQVDCLEFPQKNKFDIVLTNFPFSQETDWAGLYFIGNGQCNRRKNITKDANSVFLKHAIDACTDGGRIGVIVPEGLLFTENHYYNTIRQYVLDKCEVVSVIALDEYVFRPYTGQPTSILILKKGKPSTKPVWFFEVLDDGFEKTTSIMGRKPNLSGSNDLVKLRSIWESKPDTEQSFSIPVEKIKDNHYKLSLDCYRPGANTTSPHWLPLGGQDGVCKILIGATPSTKEDAYWELKGECLPWVRIKDMQGRYVKTTEKNITPKAVHESSVRKLRKGTVLVSFKLTIGKVAIAGCDLYTNEAIAGLVPKDDRLSAEYLYHIIPRIKLENYVQRAAKGKTLNRGILEAIRIPVPSRKEQEDFVRKMNLLEAKSIELREEANQRDQETENIANAFLKSMI